jgi:hypothetical protein
MGTTFHSMTREQKNSFNERYLTLYEDFLNAEESDEAERLKAELVQMEIEVGLYE